MARFCIPFIVDFPYKDKVAEYTIKFDHTKDSMADLIAFLEEYGTIRINIELTRPDTDVELLGALVKLNPNLYFKLSPAYIEKIAEFREKNLRYFFDIHAGTWELFNSLLGSGVTDIYITDILGFSLDSLAKCVHGQDVSLRAVVNIAQQEDPFGVNPPIKAFFIRPEDIEIYAQFIETFEFYGEDDQLATLFQIYQDQQWFGDLSEIIVGLNMNLDSRTVIPIFCVRRITCKKKCYKGSTCRICDGIADLSANMSDTDNYFDILETDEH